MLSKIKLIIMDVDGVLTDGAITYIDNQTEIKSFNAKDGFGITLGKYAGLKFGIITGRTSSVVQRRVNDLKIDFYQAGQFNKLPALQQITKNFAQDQIAYIGDDILDLVCKPSVGVFVAPADAHQRVLDCADLILNHKGGSGVIRELTDMILTAQNKLTDTENLFINGQINKGEVG